MGRCCGRRNKTPHRQRIGRRAPLKRRVIRRRERRIAKISDQPRFLDTGRMRRRVFQTPQDTIAAPNPGDIVVHGSQTNPNSLAEAVAGVGWVEGGQVGPRQQFAERLGPQQQVQGRRHAARPRVKGLEQHRIGEQRR